MIHLDDLGTQEKCWGYAGGMGCYWEAHPLEENEWDYIVNLGDTLAYLYVGLSFYSYSALKTKPGRGC